MSRVGGRVAVLAMVHNKQHTQIISDVMQYAGSRRANKAWKEKMIDALGDRNEKRGGPTVSLSQVVIF